MGTVIDEAAARLFEARVDEAVAQGARLLVGNERDGALYSPTVLDRVRPEMTLVREETFGPVSPIIAFADIDEAIRISNGTAYGLSSSVCTNRLDHIARFVAELEVGTRQRARGAGLPARADALRRHQGLRPRLQGRRAGGDEELHQPEDLFAARGPEEAEPTSMLPLLNLLAAIALLVWGTHIVRTGMLRVFGENLRRVLATELRQPLPRRSSPASA